MSLNWDLLYETFDDMKFPAHGLSLLWLCAWRIALAYVLLRFKRQNCLLHSNLKTIFISFVLFYFNSFYFILFSLSTNPCKGFGASEGPGSPEDFVVAAKAVIEFVSHKSGKPRADILLYGLSMGGTIAVMAAAELGTKKILLHSPLDALSNVMVDGCKMTGYLGGNVETYSLNLFSHLWI